jgi:uncharacterized integral membrane protein
MFKLIRTIWIVFLSVAATLFCVQNLATIEVAFLTWSIAAPRALIFFILLAVGFMLGFLMQALRPRQKPEPRAYAPPPRPPLPPPPAADLDA